MIPRDTMSKLRTPLEVYKLLPKSNCGQCMVSTCIAFAAAVIKREKRLAACPHLDKNTVVSLEGTIEKQGNLESIQEESLKELKQNVLEADLPQRAERLGGRMNRETLIIQCLGKDFEVDARGSIASHCHTHAWFSITLLDYLLKGRGEDVTGRWVPFRELKNGGTWSRLFTRRCEQPLKQIADSHSELFEDLITMFSGQSSFNNFSSDISVVLYPLPKVPILICYWKQEDGMESKLHVFFDDTAEKNLPLQSLFTLGAGIVRMLEKIMVKHTGEHRPVKGMFYNTRELILDEIV